MRWKIYIYICKDSNGREAYYDSWACERNKAKKKNAVREARVGPDRRRCVPSHHLPTGKDFVSSCKVAAASYCRRRSSATSSRCIILLRRSPSVMGSSSQRLSIICIRHKPEQWPERPPPCRTSNGPGQAQRTGTSTLGLCTICTPLGLVNGARRITAGIVPHPDRKLKLLFTHLELQSRFLLY